MPSFEAGCLGTGRARRARCENAFVLKWSGVDLFVKLHLSSNMVDKILIGMSLNAEVAGRLLFAA